ncbi:MAG: ABC transporter ATP-binding protein [Candidatus Bathyarchaeia archaeon]
MNLLEVKDLNKSFGGVRALSNLSLSVRKGELLGIIGPNGAGKTTLFNVIMGIYPPDSGDIKFQGHSIVGLPPHKICRMGIVKTYQIPRPFWNLSLLENLLVASISSRDIKLDEATQYCLKVLELVGLSELKDVQAKNLLPTQLKKLEIARALSCKPTLLLLDEPAAGLRGKEIEDLINLINEIRQTSTIILVEHRMEVVLKLSERVIVLHRGSKFYEGTPEEVLRSEDVVKLYIGERAK